MDVWMFSAGTILSTLVGGCVGICFGRWLTRDIRRRTAELRKVRCELEAAQLKVEAAARIGLPVQDADMENMQALIRRTDELLNKPNA